MTTPIAPAPSAADPVYALVADVAGAPGECLVVHLLTERDGHFEVQSIQPPTEVPSEVLMAHILTRSHDLHQLTGIKALLDKAWAEGGLAMQSHKIQIDAIRVQYAGQTTFDIDGIINTLQARASDARTRMWAHFANQIGAHPVAPPMPA